LASPQDICISIESEEGKNTTILTLSEVEKHYMGSQNGPRRLHRIRIKMLQNVCAELGVIRVVQNTAGENIMFKRDTGVVRGMSYIDLRKHMDGFALIETIEGNIDKCLESGGSAEEIKKAMLFRTI
jgi:hypothetical protein